MAQHVLVLGPTGGKAMGDIGAAQRLALWLTRHGLVDPAEIALAGVLAAVDDLLGDGGYAGGDGHLDLLSGRTVSLRDTNKG